MRRGTGGLVWLTGFPWFWPDAPRWFLLWDLPIWGIYAAAGYGAAWRLLCGRPVRWWFIALLWAEMVGALLAMGAAVRTGWLTMGHGSAALLWLYVLTGLFVARGRVCR